MVAYFAKLEDNTPIRGFEPVQNKQEIMDR